MTSSIFLPRRSRAWPEPSTHLMESTMFVLPEPFGPTMAVTPPSKWISVCRAKVLKPSTCRGLKNKLAGRVPDVGPGAVVGTKGSTWSNLPSALLDGFAELPAARMLDRDRVEGNHLRLHRLRSRGSRRRLRTRLACPASPGLLGLLGGGG